MSYVRAQIIGGKKRCSKCGLARNVERFSADRRRPTGLQSQCKDCVNERQRTPNHQQYARDWQRRTYRERTRSHILAKNSRWQSSRTGRDYRKAYRQRPHIKAHYRQWSKEYEKRPLPRLRKLLRWQRWYQAQRLTSDGTVTAEALLALFRQQKGKCRCGIRLTIKNRHLDHIYPVSRGGKHTIANVQWLCAPCNIKKSNRV